MTGVPILGALLFKCNYSSMNVTGLVSESVIQKPHAMGKDRFSPGRNKSCRSDFEFLRRRNTLW